MKRKWEDCLVYGIPLFSPIDFQDSSMLYNSIKYALMKSRNKKSPSTCSSQFCYYFMNELRIAKSLMYFFSANEIKIKMKSRYQNKLLGSAFLLLCILAYLRYNFNQYVYRFTHGFYLWILVENNKIISVFCLIVIQLENIVSF